MDNSKTAHLVCARASHDLLVWDLWIKQQCLFNEYQTRRRLYVNRLACRSFSFSTLQALNSLLIEVKVSSGSLELNRWALGAKKMPQGMKNAFRIWEYDEEKEKVEKQNEGKKEVSLFRL